MIETVTALLSPELRAIMKRLPPKAWDAGEEIRVRAGRPLEIVVRGGYSFVTPDGSLTAEPARAYRPGRDECAKLLDLLTGHSLYTFEEELRRGYITVAGGHRVGLAGRTVLEHGSVRRIRDIAGFNIRIAREAIGCAAGVMPLLCDEPAGTVHHTLVVSPPQQGKTTLIRDIARLVSSGAWCSGTADFRGGLKVGIVDERSEIAACVSGVPLFDVGPRTDVLDGCPKAEGMMMMIRSMSPDVLIADEIGRPEDAEAVREALHAGIRVVVSAHGSGSEDLKRRPALRDLLGEKLFGRIVVLRRHGGIPAVEAVLDADGRRIGHSSQRRKAGGEPHD